MKLVFPAQRKGFLKVTSSVITEALARGHQVTLLHGKDPKPGEAVSSNALRALWPTVDIVSGSATLQAHALIGDPSVGEGLTQSPVWPFPFPVYALDFVWEQRMRPAKAGVTRCWATTHHRDLFSGEYPVGYARSPVTGMTALDALPLVDPERVKRKYNLDRTVVLLFALKLGVPHLWRKTIFRAFHYPGIVNAIKDYCAKWGMLLVVKTREKNHDPRWLHRIADRVITDESIWPYTSAELVSVADQVIHFQSGAVFEAVAANVPQLSIRVPQPHLTHFPGHDVFFSRGQYTLQNWPGVVQSADYTEACDVIRDGMMTTVDPVERARYASRYVGPLDGKSASRVLDVVEAQT